jgi:hypothetical protein
MRAAPYTFGVFRVPADHPINEGFHTRNDPIFAAVEQADGFIARSGYVGEPGPASWGVQGYPDFYVERGDGWSPATLSLWEDLESITTFSYHGLHAEALRLGRNWMLAPEWPPYVLWWVAPDHIPDWSEAVDRHKCLHINGPRRGTFNFSLAFDPDGQMAKLGAARIAEKARLNAKRFSAFPVP